MENKIKKNSELPKIRISTELKRKIDIALNLINSTESNLKITLVTFREMALKHFSEKVIGEGLKISIKPKI